MAQQRQDNPNEKCSDRRRSAALYLRTASADPQDQARGIRGQRQVCQREAKRFGLVITDEFTDAELLGSEL